MVVDFFKPTGHRVLVLALVTFNSFPLTLRFLLWKCPLQNENGLAISTCSKLNAGPAPMNSTAKQLQSMHNTYCLSNNNNKTKNLYSHLNHVGMI